MLLVTFSFQPFLFVSPHHSLVVGDIHLECHRLINDREKCCIRALSFQMGSTNCCGPPQVVVTCPYIKVPKIHTEKLSLQDTAPEILTLHPMMILFN